LSFPRRRESRKWENSTFYETINLTKVGTIESTFEIIPNGKESAENFGILKASLEKSGTRLDDFDLIIASCALAHNLTLVTHNIKHFSRIEGLKMTNWSV
jgi:tRNA(fMet)-specific endonuclease VapC